jgi:uncharacterized membrane protein YqjE
MRTADGDPTAGLRGAAQQVLATLVDIGRSRLELVTVELEEERLRLARLWVAATCTLFFAFVGLVLLAGWVVLLFDPANRLAALGALAALFIAAGIIGAWRWRRLAGRKPALLHATLAELRADRTVLEARAES